MRRTSVLATMAAAATGVQAGATMVATRFVIDQTAPASLAMLRYALGFLTLLPALLLIRQARIARRDLLPISLLGIGQFGIQIAILNYGLQFIPSGRAALLFTTFPLMALLLSALFGQERLTLAKLFGVLLTIAGVAIALSERLPAGHNEFTVRGELAVLASALIGAVCSVLYQPYLRRYPALPISGVAMLASVVFLAFLASAEGFFAAPSRITGGGWVAVAFIGISSGIAYFLWLYALRHSTPSRVTVFLSLGPVTAAALSAVWLGEPLTPWLIAGTGFVVAGLAVTTAARERDNEIRPSVR